MTKPPDYDRLIFSDGELHCLDCGSKHPHSKCPNRGIVQPPIEPPDRRDRDRLEEIKRRVALHMKIGERVVLFPIALIRWLIAEVERLRQEEPN